MLSVLEQDWQKDGKWLEKDCISACQPNRNVSIPFCQLSTSTLKTVHTTAVMHDWLKHPHVQTNHVSPHCCGWQIIGLDTGTPDKGGYDES